jgi:hypothetical protein
MTAVHIAIDMCARFIGTMGSIAMKPHTIPTVVILGNGPMETMSPAILHIIAEENGEPTTHLNTLVIFSLLAAQHQMPGTDTACTG